MLLIKLFGRIALVGQMLFAAAALVYAAMTQSEGGTLVVLQSLVPALLWAFVPHVMMLLPANVLFALDRSDATVATSVMALITLSLSVLLYGDVFFGTPLAVGTLAGWLMPLPFWGVTIALGTFLALYKRPATA